jgi:hypothetical protein
MITATATATPDGERWLTGAAAGRQLGIDKRAVKRLAAAGRIAVRDLPVHARFLAADVERLSQQQNQGNT